jgi:hypothetical protein
MTARAFLTRGLVAGLVGGIVTFFVAYSVAEPHVDTAIALEDAAPAVPANEISRDQGVAEGGHTRPHSDEAGTEVSRASQKTWGLLTGTVVVGVALGGIVALLAAGTMGRIGRLVPGESTALVTLIGFVSFGLVPFLKYPATPPAVGSSDTLGDRTALYFGFVLVSVLAAVLATYAALKVRERIGTYGGVVVGVAGYLAVVVVAGQLFATVDEVGSFPASTLWSFRWSALITLATMWAVIGVVLTGLVSRLYAQEAATVQRRELAASL